MGEGQALRVVVAIMTAATLTGCRAEADASRNQSGAVTEAGEVSVFALQAGDCLMPDPETTGEVSKVPAVPCHELHGQEVVATVVHPGDTYPGAEVLAEWADGACLGEVESELDLTLDDGILVSYLLPTFAGWNQEDDRKVVCVLVSEDPAGTTGSYVNPSPSPTDGEAGR